MCNYEFGTIKTDTVHRFIDYFKPPCMLQKANEILYQDSLQRSDLNCYRNFNVQSKFGFASNFEVQLMKNPWHICTHTLTYLKTFNDRKHKTVLNCNIYMFERCFASIRTNTQKQQLL